MENVGNLVAAMLAAAEASSGNVETARADAARSIAAMFNLVAKKHKDYYDPAFTAPDAVIEVRGVDDVGKDIEKELAASFNLGREGKTTAIVYIIGTANKGHHLNKVAKQTAAKEGVPTVAVALFARDAEARKQPWVLVGGVNPGPVSNAIDEKVEVIKGLIEARRQSMNDNQSALRSVLERLTGSDADERPSGLDALLNDVFSDSEKPEGGCEGCVTGLFTSGTKSAYMKFCPGNALGEVLGKVAPHIGAIGLAPITIAAVGKKDIPGDAVIYSMED